MSESAKYVLGQDADDYGLPTLPAPPMAITGGGGWEGSDREASVVSVPIMNAGRTSSGE